MWIMWIRKLKCQKISINESIEIKQNENDASVA